MKKLNLIVTLLFISIFFGCTNEQIDVLDFANKKIKEDTSDLPNVTSEADDGEHCVYTELMAGQHHTAGSVTIDVDGDNLIVTYTTNEDWTLGTTHLSIGVCEEGWVPTNGSGNPQIGHFEFTEPYSVEPHQVIYIIPITDVGDNYCFAAHAEVEGPTGGETAWANGTEFSGNSWAMFVEFLLSNCESDDENLPT